MYATQWNKELPNDIDSYIAKTEVLKTLDMLKAEEFLENAYQKFYDVTKLYNYYIDFLYEVEKYEKIYEVENNFLKYNAESLNFLIYYTTKDRPAFSQDKIIYIKDNNLNINKDICHINISKGFKNLEKLRIVISNVSRHDVLKKLVLKIAHNNKNVEKKLKDFSPVKCLDLNNEYAFLENTPYFEIDLSDEFKNMQGNFNFDINMSMSKILSVLVQKGLLAQKYNVLSLSNTKNKSFHYVLNKIILTKSSLSYTVDVNQVNLKLLNYEVKNSDISNYKNISLIFDGVKVPENTYKVKYVGISHTKLDTFIAKEKKPYIQFLFNVPIKVKKMEVKLTKDYL